MTQTPSQTIGPYFAYGLTPQQYGYDHNEICNSRLADASAEGEHIIIKGIVLDGKNQPVNDAMIELWQANSKGEFIQTKKDGFVSFGRCGTGTNHDNQFEFHTIKPSNSEGAPYINVIVFMRGILSHMYTRIYFSDEEQANNADSFLQQIETNRRHTLIANKLPGDDLNVYEFNINMQGQNETVFLDC
ncbi:MAG: protocatechuate 3,4-dioxygenase subunit alpha [Bacteroidetes bacterium]|nr:protocatechuate 3,4-dioxygenase subunit alpha [Bacteroidota bacterium]